MFAASGCLDGVGLGGDSPGLIAANVAPDPSYKPGVGDRAVLFSTCPDAPSDQVPLLRDVTSFDKYERALAAQGASELADMEQDGALMRTPVGTRVSVLSLKDRTHIGDRHAAEVRVLDGPWKDKTAWTPAPLVTRFVQTEPAQ